MNTHVKNIGRPTGKKINKGNFNLPCYMQQLNNAQDSLGITSKDLKDWSRPVMVNGIDGLLV